MGNHDWAVLDKPGIDVEDFNPQARHAVLWTAASCTPKIGLTWTSFPAEPVQLRHTHRAGHPRQPTRAGLAIYPHSDDRVGRFALFDAALGLVGHTHKPALYRWQFHPSSARTTTVAIRTGWPRSDHLQPRPDHPIQLTVSAVQRLIVNPGSVGQPPRGRRPGRLCSADLTAKTLVQRRVSYPVELTQSQMQAAGLPKRLIRPPEFWLVRTPPGLHSPRDARFSKTSGSIRLYISNQSGSSWARLVAASRSVRRRYRSDARQNFPATERGSGTP
jgi:hypothetical protein